MFQSERSAVEESYANIKEMLPIVSMTNSIYISTLNAGCHSERSGVEEFRKTLSRFLPIGRNGKVILTLLLAILFRDGSIGCIFSLFFIFVYFFNPPG